MPTATNIELKTPPSRVSPPSMANSNRKWNPSAIIEWAVGPMVAGKYNLCRSAVPIITDLSELPGGPYVTRITGHNYRGHPGLKQTIADLYGAAPENILLAQGAAECDFLIAGAVLQEGGTAIVETPTFEPILRALEHFADRVVRLPRRPKRGFQIDPDELESLLDENTRLVSITNLHNPSGVYSDNSLLKKLAQLATDAGALLHVDEVFAPMHDWDYRNHGWSARCISVGSLHKSYGLGNLRVGWAVAPPENVAKAYSLNDMIGIVKPFATEDLANQILNTEGMREFFIDRANKAQLGRALLDELLEQNPDIICHLPDAGINALLRLPEHIPDMKFAERLLEQHETSLFPGTLFELPGWLRVSFGGDREMTREGFRRIGELIRAW